MIETEQPVLTKKSEPRVGELNRIELVPAIWTDMPKRNRYIWKSPQSLTGSQKVWRSCRKPSGSKSLFVHFRIEVNIRIVPSITIGIIEKRKLVGIPDLDSGVDFIDFQLCRVLPCFGPLVV